MIDSALCEGKFASLLCFRNGEPVLASRSPFDRSVSCALGHGIVVLRVSGIGNRVNGVLRIGDLCGSRIQLDVFGCFRWTRDCLGSKFGLGVSQYLWEGPLGLINGCNGGTDRDPRRSFRRWMKSQLVCSAPSNSTAFVVLTMIALI